MNCVALLALVLLSPLPFASPLDYMGLGVSAPGPAFGPPAAFARHDGGDRHVTSYDAVRTAESKVRLDFYVDGIPARSLSTSNLDPETFVSTIGTVMGWGIDPPILTLDPPVLDWSSAGGPGLPNNAMLGVSAAVIGDIDGNGVDDYAIGSRDGASNNGSVYIVRMAHASGPVLGVTKIDHLDIDEGPEYAGSRFGQSIAGLGPLSEGGLHAVAVGAPDALLGSAPSAGSVHIMFLNPNGTYSHGSVIVLSDLGSMSISPYDRFGYSVAASPDRNGDNIPDLWIGGLRTGFALSSGGFTGSVFLVHLEPNGVATGTYEEIDARKAADLQIVDNSAFGSSIAEVGDVSGDGLGDIAIGAKAINTAIDDFGKSTGRGSVFIATLNANGSISKPLSELDYNVTNMPPISYGDRFGIGVARAGDIDGNGVADIAVASSRSNGTMSVLFMRNESSVRSFENVGGGSPGGPQLVGGLLGPSLAPIGDADGDGVPDFMMGEPFYDAPGTANAGRIHFISAYDDESITVNITGLEYDTGARPEIEYNQAPLNFIYADVARVFNSGAYLSAFSATASDAVAPRALYATYDGSYVRAVFSEALNESTVLPEAFEIGSVPADSAAVDPEHPFVVLIETSYPMPENAQLRYTPVLQDAAGVAAQHGSVPISVITASLAGLNEIRINYGRNVSASLGPEDYAITNPDVAVRSVFVNGSIVSLNTDTIALHRMPTVSADATDMFGMPLETLAARSTNDVEFSAVRTDRAHALLSFYVNSTPSRGLQADSEADAGAFSIEGGKVESWEIIEGDIIEELSAVDHNTAGIAGQLNGSHRLGVSVAGIGDVDGDGTDDLAIGAISQTAVSRDNANNIVFLPQGPSSIFISFMDPNGTVRETSEISASAITAADGSPIVDYQAAKIGLSIEGLGKMAGDGNTYLAVSGGGPEAFAQALNREAFGSNSVYIISISPQGQYLGTVQEIVGFNMTGERSGTEYAIRSFGDALASTQDLNGDGTRDLLIGSRADQRDDAPILLQYLHSNYTSAGSTMIHPSHYPEFKTDRDNPFDHALNIVHLGDVDDDGHDDYAISRFNHIIPARNSTILSDVYILFMNSTGIAYAKEVPESVVALGNIGSYGIGLAGPGDLNGDGIPDIIISSLKPEENREIDETTGVADVLYLDRQGNATAGPRIEYVSTNQNNDAFGAALSSIGDIDGDGVQELAIGAPETRQDGSLRGLVNVVRFGTDRANVTFSGIDGTHQTPAITYNDPDGTGLRDGSAYVQEGSVARASDMVRPELAYARILNSTSVLAAFSEDILPHTVQAASFAIDGGASVEQASADYPSAAVLRTSALPPNTLLNLSVAGGMMDMQRNEVVPTGSPVPGTGMISDPAKIINVTDFEITSVSISSDGRFPHMAAIGDTITLNASLNVPAYSAALSILGRPASVISHSADVSASVTVTESDPPGIAQFSILAADPTNRTVTAANADYAGLAVVVDTVVPTLRSALLTGPSTVELEFSEPIYGPSADDARFNFFNGSSNPIGPFDLSVAGSQLAVSGVQSPFPTNIVFANASEPFFSSYGVTVIYNGGATDLAGNKVPDHNLAADGLPVLSFEPAREGGDIVLGFDVGGRPAHELQADGTNEGAFAVEDADVHSWHIRKSGLPVKEMRQVSLDGTQGLGTSVAPIGDVDGNGAGDFAVGSNGTVHVLFMAIDGTAQSWTEISASAVGAPPDSSFGHAVAGLGRLRGDSAAAVAISAPGAARAGLEGAGAVYVAFVNGAGSLDGFASFGQDSLGIPAVQPGAFGSSLAASPDLDGDAVADLWVGTGAESVIPVRLAPDGSAASAGPAINRSSLALAHLAIPQSSGFGSAVAGIGDANGDGTGDIAVGAPAHSEDNGAAYLVYLGAGGAAIGGDAVSGSAAGAAAGSAFGSSVAAAGDIDGDGLADVLVGSGGGAPGQAAGAAHVIFLNGDGDLRSERVAQGQAAESLGSSAAYAAVYNDVDAEGFVLGAPGGQGRLYLIAPDARDHVVLNVTENAYTERPLVSYSASAGSNLTDYFVPLLDGQSAQTDAGSVTAAASISTDGAGSIYAKAGQNVTVAVQTSVPTTISEAQIHNISASYQGLAAVEHNATVRISDGDPSGEVEFFIAVRDADGNPRVLTQQNLTQGDSAEVDTAGPGVEAFVMPPINSGINASGIIVRSVHNVSINVTSSDSAPFEIPAAEAFGNAPVLMSPSLGFSTIFSLTFQVGNHSGDVQLNITARDAAQNEAFVTDANLSTRIIADNARPQVENATLVNNTHLEIEFSEPLNSTFFDDSGFMLSPGSVVDADLDGKSAALTLSGLPSSGTVIFNATDYLRDLPGNRLIPYGAAIATHDTIGPALADARRINSTAIVAAFDEPILESSVSASDFAVLNRTTGAQSAAVTGAYLIGSSGALALVIVDDIGAGAQNLSITGPVSDLLNNEAASGSAFISSLALNSTLGASAPGAPSYGGKTLVNAGDRITVLLESDYEITGASGSVFNSTIVPSFAGSTANMTYVVRQNDTGPLDFELEITDFFEIASVLGRDDLDFGSEIEADTDAPRLNSATTPSATEIIVTFDQDVLLSTVSRDGFVVNGSNVIGADPHMAPPAATSHAAFSLSVSPIEESYAPEVYLSASSQITDPAGNRAENGTFATRITHFGIEPFVANITASSNNANPSAAKVGDNVTLMMRISEPVLNASGTIFNRTAEISVADDGMSLNASFIVQPSDHNRTIAYNIGVTEDIDLFGGDFVLDFRIINLTGPHPHPTVMIDTVAPVLDSASTASTTTIRVGFTTPILQSTVRDTGADFIVDGASALAAAPDTDTQVTLTVNSFGENDAPEVRLSASSQIADAANNPAENGTFSTEIGFGADAPFATSASASSSNPDPSLARAGDSITVVLQLSEPVMQNASGSVLGRAANVTVAPNGTTITAIATVEPDDHEDPVAYSIRVSDAFQSATLTSPAPDPTVMIDTVAPVMNSANTTSTTTIRVGFDTPFLLSTVRGSGADFTVDGTAASSAAADTNRTVTLTVPAFGENDAPVVRLSASSQVSDAASNPAQNGTFVTRVGFDEGQPYATSASAFSNNSNAALARAGDNVTVMLILSEAVMPGASGTVLGRTAAVSVADDGMSLNASVIIRPGDHNRIIAYSIDVDDPFNTITLTGPAPDPTVTIDTVAPVMNSANTTSTTTIRVGFDTPFLLSTVRGSGADFTVDGTAASSAAADTNRTVALTVPEFDENDAPAVRLSASSQITDPAGNPAQNGTFVTRVGFDGGLPYATSASAFSNNSNTSLARAGDNVTVMLSLSEAVMPGASGTVLGRTAAVSVSGDGMSLNASVIIRPGDHNRIIAYSIDVDDPFNTITLTGPAPDPTVTIDTVAPVMNSANTTSTTTIRVGFDTPFLLSTVRGSGADFTVDGTAASSAAADTNRTVALTVPEFDENDAPAVRLSASSQITDPAGNPAQSGTFVTRVGFDGGLPYATSASAFSNNSNTSLARAGDNVTVMLSLSEAVMPGASGTVLGRTAAVSVSGDGMSLNASVIIRPGDHNRIIAYSIGVDDLFRSATLTGPAPDPTVMIDTVAPVLDSANTTSTTTIRVGFATPILQSTVRGSGADFTVDGTAASSAAAGTNRTVTLTVPAFGENDAPEVRLSASSQVADAAGNPAQSGTFSTRIGFGEQAPSATSASASSSNPDPSLARAGDAITVVLQLSEPVMQNASGSVLGRTANVTVAPNGTTITAIATAESGDHGDPVTYSIDVADAFHTAALTGPAPDPTVRIDTVHPELDSAVQLGPSAVQLRFSEAMRAAPFGAFGLNITGYGSGTAALDGQTVMLEFGSPLPSGGSARVTVSGSAIDLAGNPASGQADFEVGLRPAGARILAPTVIAVDFGPGTEIDGSTVSAGAFSVNGSISVRSASLYAGSTVVLLTDPLSDGSSYAVQIAAGMVSSLSGMDIGNSTITAGEFSLLRGPPQAAARGGAGFGSSAVQAGDMDGDGIPEVAAGEPGSEAVRIYFMGPDGAFPESSYRAAAPGSAGSGSEFGASLARAGDIDDNGAADLFIGAPGSGAGAVYRMLANSTGGAKNYSMISGSAAGLGGGSEFGASVAPAGDLNGDGIPDILVGAPGAGAGALYAVYLDPLGRYDPEYGHDLVPHGLALAAGDRLGSSVAYLGDVGADGTADFAVGADGRGGTGAVYLASLALPYAGQAANMSLLAVADAAAGGRLGASVASVGDIDGDGAPEIMAGAPGAGRLYMLFAGADGIYRGHVRAETGAQPDGFGSSLALVHDYGAHGRIDGVPEVLVGSAGGRTLSVAAPLIRDAAYVERVHTDFGAGRYGAGHEITVVVEFDRDITLDTSGGMPYLNLDLGYRHAAAYAGADGRELRFVLETEDRHHNTDLEHAGPASLVLNGSRIAGAPLVLYSLPAENSPSSLSAATKVSIERTIPIAANDTDTEDIELYYNLRLGTDGLAGTDSLEVPVKIEVRRPLIDVTVEAETVVSYHSKPESIAITTLTGSDSPDPAISIGTNDASYNLTGAAVRIDFDAEGRQEAVPYHYLPGQSRIAIPECPEGAGSWDAGQALGALGQGADCHVRSENAVTVWTRHMTVFGLGSLRLPSTDDCTDCLEPTIGKSRSGKQVVTSGFSFNGRAVDVGRFHTTTGLVTATTGETNTVGVKVHDNYGPQNIKRVEFAIGVPDVGKWYDAEALIEVWLERDGVGVKEVVVSDPLGLLDNSSIAVATSVGSCSALLNDNECLHMALQYAYLEPPLYRTFGIKPVDFSGYAHQFYFNDGVLVTGDSLKAPQEMLVAASHAKHHPQKSGIIHLVQTDRAGGLWEDQYGLIWQIQGGAVRQITLPEFAAPHDNPTGIFHGPGRNHHLFAESRAEQLALAEEALDRLMGVFAASKWVEKNDTVVLAASDPAGRGSESFGRSLELENSRIEQLADLIYGTSR